MQLVKIQGLGAWHHHPHTDKMLLVIEGAMVMKVKGEPDVELSAGQCMVVPKMVEHMATAKEVCHVLVFEPKAELGKGDAQRPMTVADMEWI
ncbi:MAG: cupin domain-containing protein [Chlamydiia bacterium]|nr:cupin domain-containing protein [Chlamydiia bacterium]